MTAASAKTESSLHHHDAVSIEGYLKFLALSRMTMDEAEAVFASPPVDIETFITSPLYMDKAENVYPAVMEELVEINSGQYVEVVFTGGIGSGKTTGALYTTAYQLYLLYCMRNPHERFGLDPASEILFIFQNKTAALAKEVSYTRFKAMIDSSPFFNRHFMYKKKVTSRLVFPRRIEVVPVSGQESAAIGQNVMGGIIDELNYMEVVDKSRKSVDAGTFDQAVSIYNSIARRRKSRFMQQGRLPGILCLVSSRRYPGQFTDKKEEEAKTDPTIYVYDKCTWDIKPDAYSGRKFKVYIGDLNRRPRILEPDEELRVDQNAVRDIPEEHRIEFENDIINALREIAGVSTLSSHPFFVNQEKVAACFGLTESVLSELEVDFTEVTTAIRPRRFKDLNQPRWVHIDLGLTGDSAGVACGYVQKFVKVKRDRSEETLPLINIDFTLRVNPPKNDEINFEKIRLLLYKLRDQGLDIRWVSFDSFQSRDSIQILRRKGFHSGLVSVDKETQPYDILKTALYDRRVRVPEHEHLLKELLSLERVPLKDKIDHPANGCFTGETRVALANGTNPTFRELVARYGGGEMFHVYTIAPEGLRIAPAVNPRVTKHATELVEVTLDNYQVIRCTPEHRFMTLHGEWVEAQLLTPEVSLMPLYRSRSFKGGWADYERVWCPITLRRVLTHHVAYGPVPTGYVVHHKDEDKGNNDPSNLELLSRSAHYKHHGTAAWAERKAVMAEGHTKYRADAAAQAVHGDRMRQLWAEGRYANRKGKQQNHRVLSVRNVGGGEDVYDLTVPGTENFALAGGVFVHNSKDVADALCGCVWGLSMRRSIWIEHGVSLFEMPTLLREQVVKAEASMRAGPAGTPDEEFETDEVA